MFKRLSKFSRVEFNPQQRLIYYLDRVANIAAFSLENEDTESVVMILDELERIFRDFLKMRKTNPDKFYTLLYEPSFFEKYIVPIKTLERQVTEGADKSSDLETLKLNASFEMIYNSEKTLRLLTHFLGYFEKIWELAVENKRDEISKSVIYRLASIIRSLAIEEDNRRFLEEVLRLYYAIVVKGTAAQLEGLAGSLYAATIDWYPDIVFLDEYHGKDRFQLTYLDLFDKWYIYSIKRIIDHNQVDLFEALVSYLTTGLYRYDRGKQKLQDLQDLLARHGHPSYWGTDNKDNVGKGIIELDGKLARVWSVDALRSWLTDLEKLSIDVIALIDKNQQEKFQEIKEGVRASAVHRFKLRNLLQIAYMMGAYCWYKQRYRLIKFLWEYNQPPDSDSIWTGDGIVPTNPTSLVRYYIAGRDREKIMLFRDDRHGMNKYMKEYFILVMARFVAGLVLDRYTSEPRLAQVEFGVFKSFEVRQIEIEADELASSCAELKQRSADLVQLGFSVDDIEEIFGAMLPQFFNEMQRNAAARLKADERTQKISPAKVEEFRKQVMDTFRESAVVRDIFSSFQLFEDRTEEQYDGELQRRGINAVDDKAAFFDEWHVSYGEQGRYYGETLASGEGYFVIDKISRRCTKTDLRDLDGLLGSFTTKEECLILLINFPSHRFWEEFKNYVPHWQKDARRKPPIKGFGGWYRSGGLEFPVFDLGIDGLARSIIILNQQQLGKFVQFESRKRGDSPETIVDFLYINVQAYSDNDELMNAILESPPEWLRNIGEKKKQREHLEQKVLIHIFERYDFEFSPNFSGYIKYID